MPQTPWDALKYQKLAGHDTYIPGVLEAAKSLQSRNELDRDSIGDSPVPVDHSSSGLPANGERIEAVGFRPTQSASGKRAPAFNLRRLIALAFGAAVVWMLWFIFTAKAVRLDVQPATAGIEIDGSFSFRFGEIYLLREGAYRIRAAAPGFEDLAQSVLVGSERNQIINMDMIPLPGRVTFSIDPVGARVSIVGVDGLDGTAPMELRVPAGPQAALVTHPRYQDATLAFHVEGRELAQTVTGSLVPNWADVTIPTTPAGAQVRIDDEIAEVVTPGPVPVPAGEHRVSVGLPGYKTWTDILHVEARQTVELEPVTLVRADGLVAVDSTPRGASVTVDGEYRGVTPLDLDVVADRALAIRAFKVGYAPESVSVTVASGKRRSLSFSLTALEGNLAVQLRPEDAELWIDGKRRDPDNGTITLAAVPHELEVRRTGYAGFSKTILPQPGFTLELKVQLLTLEEARLEALKQVRTTSQGQELVLLGPGAIRMGASRREPGRRANEVLHDVELTRLFYLSRHEVTNAQFRVFASGHDSGSYENTNLNQANQPVVRVSWQEAALYCNWLSAEEGLQPFYREEFSKIIGFDSSALGYRLPTEAEWAWTARDVEGGKPLRFPWGDKLPPPKRHGNYADLAAAHTVGRIIFGYNDNHIAGAPIGTFDANAKGIFDIGGNVAEWVHDHYHIPDPNAVVDPFGPEQGDYHLIRGASWMHGTVTDLRLSFRDYGADGRADVGFRIARFAE